MNEQDEVSMLANKLYANLRAVCPKDTGNMKNNITIDDLGDRYVITVSEAVNKYGVNYAAYVNYNWGARSKRKKASYERRYRERPQKEKNNYMWVERTIEHTFASMYGKGSVSNEL